MITSIVLRNFRGHREKILKFGPKLNTILGANEAGKTTINEAISFGFYGCDQYGNRNPDHLITFGEEACEVVIATDKASFTRTKRRSGTSSVSLARNGVPPIKMNQTELSALLGVPFELFASLYNAGFFMELPQTKKLEVIGQIAQLDRKALLLSMVPGIEIPPKIKFENLKVDAQTMATERRQAQNQLAADQGALAQVEAQLKEFQTDLDLLNLDETKAEIERLTAHVDLFDLYQKELAEYRLALASAKEREEGRGRLQAEKERLELELKSIEGSNKSKIDSRSSELHQIAENASLLYPQKLSLPTLPLLPSIQKEERNCTRCGQPVSPKLLESLAAEREKIVNDHNKEARRVADHNVDVERKLEVLAKRTTTLHEEIQALTDEDNGRGVRRELLKKRLGDITLTFVRVPPVPTRPDGDEKTTRDRLADLRAKFHAHQLFSQKKEQFVSREAMFKTAVEQKIRLVDNLKVLEEALLKLPEVEVRQTLERLRTPGVEMMLLEEELVITDLKRVPYPSLSTGRKLKISVELCKTFQKIVPRAPHFYFVDNVELMDEYLSLLPTAQVFIAKVDPALSDLQVIQG